MQTVKTQPQKPSHSKTQDFWWKPLWEKNHPLFCCTTLNLLLYQANFPLHRWLTPIIQENRSHILLANTHHEGDSILLIKSKDNVLTWIYGQPSTESHHDQRS